jgi:hypothetical protein
MNPKPVVTGMYVVASLGRSHLNLLVARWFNFALKALTEKLAFASKSDLALIPIDK